MNPSEIPATAQRAWVIALLLAFWNLAEFIWVPASLSIVSVLILLAAAWGIRRGRVWSAYGLAFIQLSGAVVTLVLLAVRDVDAEEMIVLVAVAAFSLVVSAVFFHAGWSLAAAGAEQGRRAPWLVLAAAPVGFAVLSLFVRPYSMPTASMEETLLLGDHLFVRIYPKPPPVRDRVMVFQSPINPDDAFVKRIVGVPGDKIKLLDRQLIRNGEPVDEPYVVHRTDYSEPYRDNFPNGDGTAGALPPALEMLRENVVGGELVVPEGRYFVLGDNRDRSLDSRYIGFVREQDFFGTPLFVYFSAEREPSFGPESEITRIRWERFLKPLWQSGH